jgi:hypothetical protein
MENGRRRIYCDLEKLFLRDIQEFVYKKKVEIEAI